MLRRRKVQVRMKELIWKYRKPLVFLALLVIQVPFFFFMPTSAAKDSFIRVVHVLVSSGLMSFLFSRFADRLIGKMLYKGLRRDWKEVRVIYSEGFARGTGDVYPREPTLLIQEPLLGSSSRAEEIKGPLFAQDGNGRLHQVSAARLHRPMSLYFNNSCVGKPEEGKEVESEAGGRVEFATGHWSQLQLMQVGPDEKTQLVSVGFPDTLIR